MIVGIVFVNLLGVHRQLLNLLMARLLLVLQSLFLMSVF